MNSPEPPPFELVTATSADLDALLPLVRAYHRFDGIDMSEERRRRAVRPLLDDESAHGRIWLIESSGVIVGDVAVCFGYSIEFEGPDAFVDELYIDEAARGRGIGAAVLRRVMALAAALGVTALHLEVARDNARARRLYSKLGFGSRERFHLMSWRPAQEDRALESAPTED